MILLVGAVGVAGAEPVSFTRLCGTVTPGALPGPTRAVNIVAFTDQDRLAEAWDESGFGDCGGEPGVENQPPPLSELDANVVFLVRFRSGGSPNDVTGVEVEGRTVRVSVTAPSQDSGEARTQGPGSMGVAVAVPRAHLRSGAHEGVLVVSGLERASTSFEVGELPRTGPAAPRVLPGVAALVGALALYHRRRRLTRPRRSC